MKIADTKVIKSDYLIIGSGVAGLLSASLLSEFGTVSIITKETLYNSNSFKAQGGIACVVSKKDTFEKHIEDTLKAGSYLGNYKIVENIIQSGPKYINNFIDRYGIQFTKNKTIYSNDISNNEYHLGLEGGHSEKRILHCGDYTGKILISKLVDDIKKTNISIYENHIAIKLLNYSNNICVGVKVFDNINFVFKIFISPITILATGGIGAIYSRTTNSNVTNGDGIAMAIRKNIRVDNMEFVQFHPTMFYSNIESNVKFLISEAIRGEGAKLKVVRNNIESTFMNKYHKDSDLAPRDIVARAIYLESKDNKYNIYLDIRNHGKEFLQQRFPDIYRKCELFNINLNKDLIPIFPAAHYSCGGIATNYYGATDMLGLYAIGEVACNGFHGANRLASNSLLESIVVSYLLVEHVIRNNFLRDLKNCNDYIYSISKLNYRKDDNYTVITDIDIKNIIKLYIREIEKIMWKYVGIYKTKKGLRYGLQFISKIKESIIKYKDLFSLELLKLRNIIIISEIIINSAINRKTNIGLHFKYE